MPLQDNRNDYDKEQRMSGIPFFIAAFVIIVFLGYYIFQQDIDKQFFAWKDSLMEKFEDAEPEPSASDETIRFDDIDIIDEDEVETGEDVDMVIMESESNDISEVENNYTREPLPSPVSPSEKPEKPREISAVPSDNISSNNKFRMEYFRDDNGKYGFKNASDGSIIIDAQYDNVVRSDRSNPTLYMAVQKNKKYGVINTNNSIVVPFAYDRIEDYGNYWKTRKKENSSILYGLIRSSDAKILIPSEYESLQIYTSSFILVKKNGIYGSVNDRNEIVVPFKYKSAAGSSMIGNNPNTYKIYLTDENGNTVIFDTKGRMVSE